MPTWNIDTKISFSPFISIGEHALEIKPNWHLVINDIDYPVLKEAAVGYSEVIKEYVHKNPTSKRCTLNLDIKNSNYDSVIQQFFLWQPIEINNDNFSLIQALANQLQITILTSMLSMYDYFDSQADTLLTNDCTYLKQNELLIEELFNDNPSKSKSATSENSEIIEKVEPIQLSRQLFNFCIARPQKIEDVIQFVRQRSKIYPAFIEYVLKKFVSGSEFCQEISFIIEKLISAGILKSNDIYKYKYNNIDKITTKALPFNLIQYSTNQEQYSATLSEALKKYPSDQINIEKLSANNWELQRSLTDKGVNPSEIAVAIRNDDLQKLKSICKNPNLTIDPSPYERCTYINKSVSLLQYAAFFGSIKCFSYLQFCKATVSDKENLYKYAVCGGNSQILKICEPLNKPYDETLWAGIVYHRPVICSNYFANNLEILKKCIEFDQTQVFLNFLKENKATNTESHLNTPLNEILFQVVKQNNVPFLELLLKISGIDLNTVDKNTNLDVIQTGTLCGSVECIKLIAQETYNATQMLEKADPELLRQLNDFRALKEYHLVSPRSPRSPRSSSRVGNVRNAKLNEGEGSPEVNYDKIASKFSANLLRKIVDFDERNQFDNNSTILHNAARNGNPELIDLLLDKPFSIDINSEDVYGNTPLLTASASGSSQAVEQLLRRRDLNRNAKDKHDYTALHIACENGQAEVASILIKNGFDVNARGYYNNTPLYFAAKSGSIDTAVILLKRKDVDINAPCDGGNTALHVAASQNDAKMVEVLLKKSGINANVKNTQRKTPKELTTKKKIIELIDNFQPA